MEDTAKKRIIRFIYVAIVGAALIFFLYADITGKLEEYAVRDELGYRIQKDYTHSRREDAAYPLGVADVLTFTLEEAMPQGENLVFYTVHENVEVYIDGELIYRKGREQNQGIGKTPGNMWNIIPLYYTDEGSAVEIRLIPVYEFHVGSEPEIMIGDMAKIFMHYTLLQTLPFICAFAVMAVGLIFIILTFVEYKKYLPSGSLLMMGFVALIIGLWKLSDLSVTHIYFPNSVGLSYMTLTLLMMVVVPFALYEREMFSPKYAKYLNYVARLALGGILLSLILQIANVADFRETLWIHHAIIVVLVVVSVLLIVLEVRSNGWNKRLVISVIFISICGLGVVSDMLLFYGTSAADAGSFAMIGFLFYTIVLGYISMREAQEWIAIGHKASSYRNMAYHDQLTGMLNRNAYANQIGGESFCPDNCIVVMCDLNNLKYCNDTYGHDVGDRYIKSGAEIINNTFGELGKVYRMGGDEFCVVLENVSMADCERAKIKLRHMERDFNASGKEEFCMQIACGYQPYESGQDYDIGDTLRRADHKMYENKIELKRGKSA